MTIIKEFFFRILPQKPFPFCHKRFNRNEFNSTPNGTRVVFRMAYSSVEQIQAIVKKGFENGIRIYFEQLNVWLETKIDQKITCKN